MTVLHFWSSRRSAAVWMGYLSCVVLFVGWVIFCITLNPRGFFDPTNEYISFIGVLSRPAIASVLAILIFGQWYVTRQAYGYPVQKRASLVERLEKSQNRKIELSLQLAIANRRNSRQMTELLFTKSALSKVLEESCPVCLARVEEYLEVEKHVTN